MFVNLPFQGQWPVTKHIHVDYDRGSLIVMCLRELGLTCQIYRSFSLCRHHKAVSCNSRLALIQNFKLHEGRALLSSAHAASANLNEYLWEQGGTTITVCSE